MRARRDLHREQIGATVGVVDAGRVEEDEVHFTGDVRVRPFTDVVRAFWDRIRLSLGFRDDIGRPNERTILYGNTIGSRDEAGVPGGSDV